MRSTSWIWICGSCAASKDERPAHEHQHLFPGCGYVCGYFTRICAACWPDVKTWPHDKITELYKKDHERHHQSTPAEKPPLVQLGGNVKKKEETPS